MAFRTPVTTRRNSERDSFALRTAVADANELRDWRIYAELAQRLIIQARRLYANESLEVDLANSVYALDSTTIDLCMSVFPWAHFRSTKHAPAKAGVGGEDAHATRSARQHPRLHPYLRRLFLN